MHDPIDTRLIQLAYEMADENDCWETVLTEMAVPFQANHAHVFLIESAGRVVESYDNATDPKLLERYHREFQHRDPRILVSRSAPERVFSDVDVIDSTAFEKSALYNELLAAQDVRYTLFVNAQASDELLVAQAFMRPKAAAPFNLEDVHRLERLVPHVARAVRLRSLVRSMRGQIQDLLGALDSVPMALAILDEARRVVCANRRAAAILKRSEGFVLRRQQLTADDPSDAALLRAAFDEAVRLANPLQQNPKTASEGVNAALCTTIEVRRTSKRSLAIFFLPLHGRNRLRLHGDRSSRVLAVLHDPEATVQLDAGLVAQLHGLTTTEGHLAVALAQGQTSAEFARMRGISEQTARTHLKRVLDKTGTHRQADLVRVLLSTAALHMFDVAESGT